MTDAEAALLAGISYFDEGEAREFAEGAGWKCALVAVDETECFIFTREGETAFVFRGTSSWKDLATDLKIRKKNTMRGGVHSGFSEYVDKVHERLEPFYSGDEKVSIVGHSLGGAAAQIYAFRLAREGRRIDKVVTFGGPRVGDRAWAKNYNHWLSYANTRRYRRVLDPVPHMPFRRWGFRHTNGERYIDRNGSIHTTVSWWYAAWDRMMAMTFRRKLDLKPELLEAHSMSGYERLLT